MATRKAKVEKKTRIPVSGKRDVLTATGKEKGWVYRWVNDIENRLPVFKAGGWEIAQSEDVEVGSLGVDNPSTIGGVVSKNVGQGVTAYLMRIKDEYYDEDQVEKSKGVDAKEELLNEHIRELSGRYGGIQINK